jgi:hypothetical protein
MGRSNRHNEWSLPERIKHTVQGVMSLGAAYWRETQLSGPSSIGTTEKVVVMRHCSTGQPVVTSADLYQLAYKHDVLSSAHAPGDRLIEYE